MSEILKTTMFLIGGVLAGWIIGEFFLKGFLY